MLSCKRGHIDVVKVLLCAGAELSVKDSKGRVARDQASRRGNEKILELLNPATQMRLMQDVARAKRAQLLTKLFLLVQHGRVKVDSRHLSGSRSIRVLAHILGAPLEDAPCLAYLPGPVVNTIISYLPLPRLWATEIERLERRVRIDAFDAAVYGSFTIMEEIFNDWLRKGCGGPDGCLLRVASDRTLQDALLSGPCAMPARTLSTLITEADLKRVLSRHGSSISCGLRVAEQMVSLTKEVHAWYMWQDAPGLHPDPSQLRLSSMASSRSAELQALELTSGMESDSDESDM